MSVRGAMRRIYHRLPVPWRPPRGVRAFQRLNEEMQWWPPARIEEYQVRRLRAFLCHAQAHVPYYADLFAGLGFDPEQLSSLEEFRRLPLLEKACVRDNPKAFTAADWRRWKPVVRRTSGTTGQRLEVLMSERAQHAHAADRERRYRWAGYHPGDRLAVFLQFLSPAPEEHCYRHRPRNWLCLNLQVADSERLRWVVARLAEFRPEGILAYPSHLYWLYQYLAEHPNEAIRPRVLMTDAEMLYDFQRQQIEAFFGVRVADYYAMSEHAASAAQCAAGAYHVGAEYALVEVLRPDGTPARPGEMGEVVGTNFENYAMPLVRYRTGDLAVVGDDPCPCGRGLPTLARVVGRTQDVMLTPTGPARFPNWSFSFHDVPGVREVQIIQEEVHRFRIKAVPGPGYQEVDADRLAHALCRSLEFPAQVAVELVERIPRTVSGKFRLMECRVPTSLWVGNLEQQPERGQS
ncbi:MAG: phenylacetate--CoA ligase family protein [Armatimonadetes bacterium]|nr:phenylacetate--CoA ligase family protein [Armatimonadota bacterium]